MGMKPICPKCGTVRVKTAAKVGECLESDCLHVGPAKTFKPTQRRPEAIGAPNRGWRDGSALSMDGIEN